MDYTKNNKLIAEFMGLEIRESKHKYITTYYVIIDDMPTDLQDLKYHKSWDWLMPVIEEIYDRVDKENIEEFYCFKHCIPNRDTTYQAVVEFIKFYNDQNK
tara:strand:+ start:34 stop:336 length:303 start_codon:yes stop_codon:yes gene_type:complete